MIISSAFSNSSLNVSPGVVLSLKSGPTQRTPLAPATARFITLRGDLEQHPSLWRYPHFSWLLAINHSSLLPCLVSILALDARSFFPTNDYYQLGDLSMDEFTNNLASKFLELLHFGDLHPQAVRAAPSS